LGWKRLDGLKLIVNYLARYPYIKEIIIWNNNQETKLNKKDFEFDASYGPAPELQVYNGQENLHDFAKYMSCSLAKYQHCYFQDDDWLNTHMDALYTNFLTSPSLIHTNTLPLIHMEHRRWTFTNAGIVLAQRSTFFTTPNSTNAKAQLFRNCGVRPLTLTGLYPSHPPLFFLNRV
jgi:hypothetical protein